MVNISIPCFFTWGKITCKLTVLLPAKSHAINTIRWLFFAKLGDAECVFNGESLFNVYFIKKDLCLAETDCPDALHYILPGWIEGMS